MRRELILEKGGTFAKKIFMEFADDGSCQIIKECRGRNSVEHRAFHLMESLGLGDFFAKVVSCSCREDVSIIVIEYVRDDVTSALATVPSGGMEKFWTTLIAQLARLIRNLESHLIQHNDFTPENMRLLRLPGGCYAIKVIDLETVVDYSARRIYPSQVTDATSSEQERMGWRPYFHAGADLNQMLGELVRQHGDHMPGVIRRELERRVIAKDKEFPYALAGLNPETTGSAIEKMMKNLERG